MKYIQLRRNRREIRLGLLCICVCMVFFGCGSTSASYFEKETVEEENSESADKRIDTEQEVMQDIQQEVVVFVCGHVRYPGVYALAQESRICDAIDAAGGMTEKACKDYWNLAERIEDGQKIYVPTKAEAKEESFAEQNIENVSVQRVAVQEDDGKININTAELEQLMKLSGIGESRAKAIITYRTEHGAFSTIEEIKNVSGIGDAIFSHMKDQITI